MALSNPALLASISLTTNVASYQVPAAAGTFTPTANAWIFAKVVWSGPLGTSIGNTPTCSGGGLTWSSMQDVTPFGTAASPTRAQGWFYAKAPGSPSAMQVTIDFAGQNQSGCNISVDEIAGSTASSPRLQAASATVDAAISVSATLGAGLTTGSLTWALCGNDVNAAMTPRAGWTEIDDGGYGTPSTRIETQYLLAGETTGSVTKAAGNAGMAITIVEVPLADPAAGGWGPLLDLSRNRLVVT